MTKEDEARLAFEVGPGFVSARSCPDCLHTRCGEDCVCNCDAAVAEAKAAELRNENERLRAQVATLTAERDEQAARVAALTAALERISGDWAVVSDDEFGPLCGYCGQAPENCELDCLRRVAEGAIRARAGEAKP